MKDDANHLAVLFLLFDPMQQCQWNAARLKAVAGKLQQHDVSVMQPMLVIDQPVADEDCNRSFEPLGHEPRIVLNTPLAGRRHDEHTAPSGLWRSGSDARRRY